jgi:hypothetical protein
MLLLRDAPGVRSISRRFTRVMGVAESVVGRSSVDITAVPDIPEAQWCLPFRRQQAAVSVPVSAEANGARRLQAMTESTRLATIRRIISMNASTSRGDVTIAGDRSLA